MGGAVLDSEVIALIEAHPSIIVGTCDRALNPVMARGFGARVAPDARTLEVIVSRWPGPETLANLEATGQIAVTFTAVETFEAYQIKGRALDWGDCTPEDLALIETFTPVIRRRIMALGEPEVVTRTIFTARGQFRVRILPEAVFVQTPGRQAGQPR
jgi:hypothetical protein